ncbi:MAG: hypothetical protein BWK80_06700 [Desulfobacteraceae bacterium IS3]|nr:MAG: hypothetical protein BWK80_06700 [Desulfobacteraceae bacterium IS3]
METLIIREMEPSLVEELKKAAEQEGKSMDRFLAEIIERYLNMRKREEVRTYHDMDHLFGTWSEEEFSEIQGKIDSERNIDRELWE